jgi:hypothetical protein
MPPTNCRLSPALSVSGSPWPRARLARQPRRRRGSPTSASPSASPPHQQRPAPHHARSGTAPLRIGGPACIQRAAVRRLAVTFRLAPRLPASGRIAATVLARSRRARERPSGAACGAVRGCPCRPGGCGGRIGLRSQFAASSIPPCPRLRPATGGGASIRAAAPIRAGEPVLRAKSPALARPRDRSPCSGPARPASRPSGLAAAQRQLDIAGSGRERVHGKRPDPRSASLIRRSSSCCRRPRGHSHRGADVSVEDGKNVAGAGHPHRCGCGGGAATTAWRWRRFSC